MQFEILDRNLLFEGKVFDVERIHTRLPDGRTNDYDMVKHHGSVTIVPYDQDGNIWFVEQYRLGAEQVLLELPAGVIEQGEDPVQCAHREVREEIGMAATELKKLGEMYLAPGYSTELMTVFLATGIYQAPLKADSDEFLRTKKIPLQRVYKMTSRGEIRDSKTLAALLMAQPDLLNKP
jgi:ADP-ribose pyrophosphatase